MPQGYGYEVGRDVGLNFIVVSAYYLAPEQERRDDVSFHLSVVEKNFDTQNLSPVRSLMLRIIDTIPGKSVKSIENFYVVKDDVSLQPLKFAIHTHAVGSKSEMWIVSRDGVWSRIGQHTKTTDEDFPTNVFFDVENPDRRIVKGDVIALRCMLTNEREMEMELSHIYSEMCRGYLLYGSKNSNKLPVDTITVDNVDVRAAKWSWLNHTLLREHHMEAQPL